MIKNIKIAPEGYKIIFNTLGVWLITFIISVYSEYSWIEMLSIYLFYILLIVCYFFRDPSRKNTPSKNFLSPADGRIISITDYIDPDIGKSIKIAIFLSFFNVHRQWVPIESIVLQTFYNPGRFFGAYRDKASMNNEQTSIIFKDNNNNIFKIKQIAGFVARRIVNHMNPNEEVEQGEKLGFIKFGSRVEIIIPDNFNIKIKKGMKVKGCKTIIGNF
jgi:phosphatidylserine decarboxylase|tara:strand:- start:100 stop:750 length:651 start_codon:yes stop_codon:yes gene_type:complete